MLFLQVRIIPRLKKKAVPAIDTVSAGTANWSWMVLGGLLKDRTSLVLPERLIGVGWFWVVCYRLAHVRHMNETLTKFRNAVSDSTDLQEKVKAGADLVALGKENGYEFTQEELNAGWEELQESDEGLTEFELDVVSGGAHDEDS
jgi:predicted ribosomally synthesized peptide with nif11-like leader